MKNILIVALCLFAISLSSQTKPKEVITLTYPHFLHEESPSSSDLEILVYNLDRTTNKFSLEEFRPHKKNFNSNTFHVKKLFNQSTPEKLQFVEYFRTNKNEWLMISTKELLSGHTMFKVTSEIVARDTVQLIDKNTFDVTWIIHEYLKCE